MTTPWISGPWQPRFRTSADGSDDWRIETVNGRAVVIGHPHAAGDVRSEVRLMAAAPELYEALELALRWVPAGAVKTRRRICAVLTKACPRQDPS